MPVANPNRWRRWGSWQESFVCTSWKKEYKTARAERAVETAATHGRKQATKEKTKKSGFTGQTIVLVMF